MVYLSCLESGVITNKAAKNIFIQRIFKGVEGIYIPVWEGEKKEENSSFAAFLPVLGILFLILAILVGT